MKHRKRKVKRWSGNRHAERNMEKSAPQHREARSFEELAEKLGEMRLANREQKEKQ